MFHGVYRVAEALIALQQAGNVSYMNWKMEVTCEQKMIEALSNKALQMENDLDSWSNAVNQSRSKYYELNYFTTPQLLYLRRHLGALKTDTTMTSLNQGVLMLLKSVSTNVTIDAVKVAATSPQQGLQTEVVHCTSPSAADEKLNISHNLKASRKYLSIEQLGVTLKKLAGKKNLTVSI